MIGENLKKLRVEKSLTQGELAKMLGVSASSIGMYEQGRREPDHELLIKMSKIFSVSVDELLGIDEKVVGEEKSLEEFIDEVLKLVFNEKLTLNGELLERKQAKKIADSIKLGVEFAKRDISSTEEENG